MLYIFLVRRRMTRLLGKLRPRIAQHEGDLARLREAWHSSRSLLEAADLDAQKARDEFEQVSTRSRTRSAYKHGQ
jgi:hypothetical protein